MPKYKVAYNACYGGFSLSREACEWLRRERNAKPNDPEFVAENAKPNFPKWYLDNLDRPKIRHHPDLIAVIEALGTRANGPHAHLQIAEVNGPYMIEEYDGMESVLEPEDLIWIDPSKLEPL